jgi:8-amino-7-oxononanoate synthase
MDNQVYDQATGLAPATFERRWSLSDDVLLNQHQIDGNGVLPAAAQIAIAVSGALHEKPGELVCLHDIAFLAPLAVAPETEIVTQFTLNRGMLRLASRQQTLPTRDDGWRLHCTGRVATESESEPVFLNLPALQARCTQHIDAEAIRRWYDDSGIRYGASLRVVVALQRHEHESLALVHCPPSLAQDGDSHALLALVEGAFQTLGLTQALQGGKDGAGGFMPFVVERFRMMRQPSGSGWCLCVASRDERDGANLMRGDCYVLSHQGEVLVEMLGVTLKRQSKGNGAAQVRSAAPPAAASTCSAARALVWAPEPSGARRAIPRGTWIVMLDPLGIGARVAERLRAEGSRCVEVTAGRGYRRLGEDRVTIDPELSSDFARALESVDAASLKGIIHLWNASPRAAEPADLQELDERLALGLHSIVLLVQSMQSTVTRRSLELWFGSTDAQPANEASPSCVAEKAAALGLVRALVHEYPQHRVRLLDLSTDDETVERQSNAFLDEMSSESNDIEVAYRGGARLVRKWVDAAGEAPTRPAFSSTKGVYLITGGRGEIGAMLTQHLCEHSAQAVFLLGRSLGGSTPSPSSRQPVASARAPHTHVEVVQGDVADLERMRQVKHEILERYGRLDGIIHCAGVLRDGLLLSKDAADFRAVLRPKVHGTWVLDQVFRDVPMEFVVLFSSISGVLGNLGQSDYAAANAYLDAMAVSRRGVYGLPWMSLDWGLWQNVGMASKDVERLRRSGVESLSTDEALQLFSWALLHPRAQWVLAPPSRAAALPVAVGTGPVASTLVQASEPEQAGMAEFLMSAVAHALGMPTDKLGLDDNIVGLGLDSIMAVEVATQMQGRGIEMDPSLLFRYSTVRELIELHRSAVVNTPPPPRPPSEVDAGNPHEADAGNPHEAPRRTQRLPLARFLRERLDEVCQPDLDLKSKGHYFYEPILKCDGRHVEVGSERLLNLASYSYLGLNGHPSVNAAVTQAVEEFGAGAHGSRLLAGTTRLHIELEKRIAEFESTEDAVVFSSGYIANIAVISTLMRRGDFVICDMYNHASIVDGCRLSGAECLTFRHNDMKDLDRCLVRAGSGPKLVIVDSVFSMSGDVAKLPELVTLCTRHDAALMVDEAHSLGVLGSSGRGLAEHWGMDPDAIAIKMGTLSKAIPSSGGFIAGSEQLIFALKNNARAFMLSGALTPGAAAAATTGLSLIAAQPNRVTTLQANAERYRTSLRAADFNLLHSEGPVVPIVCKDNASAYRLARLCRTGGVFTQPIVYPAVPLASPRLRTIITAAHTPDDIDFAIDVITRSGRELDLVQN